MVEVCKDVMSDHAPSRPCVFCSAVLRVFSIPASPLDHRPANHFCHDQSQPPSIPASPLDHRPANRLCHDQSQPPSIPASPLDHCPTNRLCSAPVDPALATRSLAELRELGIGFHLSSKCSCRGGKRKERKISAASTTSDDVRRSPGTRSVDSRHLAPVTDVAADVPHRGESVLPT